MSTFDPPHGQGPFPPLPPSKPAPGPPPIPGAPPLKVPKPPTDAPAARPPETARSATATAGSAPRTRDIEPPGFKEILEGTFQALVMPREVFGSLGLFPPPAPGLLIGNVVLWTVAGVAVEAALGSFASLNPARISLAALAAVPGSLAAACMVYVMAVLAGGTGGFARALETVSLMSALVPLTAVLAPAPAFRLAVYLYGVYLAIRAATYMHRVPAVQAALVFGLAGSVASGGLWLLTKDSSPWRSLPGGTGIAEAGHYPRPDEEQAALPLPKVPDEALGPGSLSMVGASIPEGKAGEAPPISLGQLQQIMRLAGRLPAPGGGAPNLELVRPGQPPSPEQIRQMQRWGFGMLKDMQKTYSNPEFQRRLDPKQARQFQELMQLSEELMRTYEKRSQGGRAAAEMSDAEAQRMMLQLQGIVDSMGQGAPPAKRRPRSGK